MFMRNPALTSDNANVQADQEVLVIQEGVSDFENGGEIFLVAQQDADDFKTRRIWKNRRTNARLRRQRFPYQN